MDEQKEQYFFGEYNHIYFLEENGISAILDRAHRKDPVLFQEDELEDLLASPREKPEMMLYGTVSDMWHEGKPVNILGQTFIPKGIRHQRFKPEFGRGLEYQIVDNEDNHFAVLLTVDLPANVRYKMHWSPVEQNKNEFLLAQGIKLTIFTDIEWQFSNDTFAVEIGDKEGKVTFLVESFLPENPIRNIALFVAKGREIEALQVRALCGRGFIPCFVFEPNEIETEQFEKILKDISDFTCVSIGLNLSSKLQGTKTIQIDENPDFEMELSHLLESDIPNKTLFSPLNNNAVGLALFLAIQNNARLKFDDSLDQNAQLCGSNGEILKNWSLANLLSVLPSEDVRDLAFSSNFSEVVVCESSSDDLLVAQAIGYAYLKNCNIIFIPRIEDSFVVDETIDASISMNTLVSIVDLNVPKQVREPNAETLTIFTRSVPLHLVKVDNSNYWMDKYTLAHLPGQVASYLVPRYFRKQLLEVPPVPFSLIFDALGFVGDTEGRMVSDQLMHALSHPILLSPSSAFSNVLKELLGRLDIDFLLLITHGGDDAIEDSHHNLISSSDISQWQLRGSPLVFNNSCTSWTTTGMAFLTSGARSYIGSLWPIQNKIAAEIAGKIGMELRDNETKSIPMLLAQAAQNVTSHFPNARISTAAYIYVGLPETYLLVKPSISSNEKVSLLTTAFHNLYNMLEQIVSEGRPDIAVVIHQAIRNTIQKRFIDLIVPNEIPPHLPMMGHITVLDIDYMMALADFNFGKTLIQKLPQGQQLQVVLKMNEFLETALYELSTWDDRHDKHLNRTEQDRDALSQKSGLPINALGDEGFYKMACHMTLTHILPFIWDLAELKQEELAKHWLDLAKKLVTTQADLSVDGSVSEAALLGRIKEGTLKKYRNLTVASREWSETSLDIMQSSVNKSDLANRFGITYLKLEDYKNAETFFRLACNLAEPGSQNYANAESNLSNALRKLGRYGETFDGYIAAMDKQEKLGDFRNALITAANMIRIAVKMHKEINEIMLLKMQAWIDSVSPSEERTLRACDLYGALSKYYISQGKKEKAKSYNEKILLYLQGPYNHLQLTKNFNEIAEWYYENHQYSRAGQEAEKNAILFSRLNMVEASIGTFLISCEGFLEAYNRNFNKKYLLKFLDNSLNLSLILNMESGLRSKFWDKVQPIWDQTFSLWKQFEKYREYRLALKAYTCVKSWSPDKADVYWDLYESAFHPINIAEIENLAQKRKIKRLANVKIDNQKSITVEVTTVRNLSDVNGTPEILYGYLPLYKQSIASITIGDGNILGGVAIYTLQNGKSVTIREREIQNLRTDGHGAYLYNELWGSHKISYDLTISLGLGLIPIELKIEEISGTTPVAKIKFSSAGCQIKFSIEDFENTQDPIWLSKISLFFREAPGKLNLFEDPNGPFAEEIPFSLYQMYLEMLSRK
jgi:hypothetical protein